MNRKDKGKLVGTIHKKDEKYLQLLESDEKARDKWEDLKSPYEEHEVRRIKNKKWIPSYEISSLPQRETFGQLIGRKLSDFFCWLKSKATFKKKITNKGNTLFILTASLFTQSCDKEHTQPEWKQRTVITNPESRALMFKDKKELSEGKLIYYGQRYSIHYSLPVYYQPVHLDYSRPAFYKEINPEPIAVRLKDEAIHFIYYMIWQPIDTNLIKIEVKLYYSDSISTFDYFF